MRIIFIGGGNMAEAIFSKLTNHEIIVIQRNLQKIEKLKILYPQINFLSELNFDTNFDDLVFIAIKPQDAKDSCDNIKKYVMHSTIISVMAGINCATLERWLGNKKICRAMPNTPAQLGLGATAVYFTQTADKKAEILNIFAKLGSVYSFNNENEIDQMTAIASSSIAYVHYFIEALIQSAVDQFKFAPELAKDITLQVIKGSIALIEQNPDISIEQLRHNVTSKKGTTEQAINVFEQYNLKKIIHDAELACYTRAKELSALFANN